MVITAHTLLIVAAMIQFVFAAIGWPVARISWIASGLATFMVALLVS